MYQISLHCHFNSPNTTQIGLKDVSTSVNFKEVEQTQVDRIEAHEELEAHGELKILNWRIKTRLNGVKVTVYCSTFYWGDSGQDFETQR